MAASATPVTNGRSRKDANRHIPAAPSPALDAVGARPRRAQKRPTQQASYELANHAKAYLEGGQFASGYDFLNSLLAAGTSISTPARPYLGLLAPPSYIALAASLVAYPKFTTKAQSKDAIKGPNAALRYLQCLHNTLDSPAYPTIRKAFSFPEERNRRRAPGHRSAGASLSPEPNGDVEQIMGEAANHQSLWYRAEDFWHIVGWALNCSVAHKKRWDRWKLWLETILDFLEADWQVCTKHSWHDEVNREATPQESLIWHYIAGVADSTSRTVRRRIVKAILAMATPESLKDYPEIWARETAAPRKNKREGQPFGQIDFETGDMGDYASDEDGNEDIEDAVEDMDDASVTSSTDSTDGGLRSLLDAVEQLGGQDAIMLRQRFIALLAQVAHALPTNFTTLSDFFDNMLEDYIQLPTIIFKVLLSTQKSPAPTQLAFNANLLLPLVSGTIPDYIRYEPTQEHFEAKLLPLKGTNQSFATNAKISLILEQMFLYMMSENAITPTVTLRKAMTVGIDARQGVYGVKRGGGEEEAHAKTIMKACSERLLGLLEVLEMSMGRPPQALKGKNKPSLLPTFLSFGSGSSLSPAPDSGTEADD